MPIPIPALIKAVVSSSELISGNIKEDNIANPNNI
jgi:hypothetical protein